MTDRQAGGRTEELGILVVGLAIRGDFLLLQFLQSFFAVSRFVFQKCLETGDGLIQ